MKIQGHCPVYLLLHVGAPHLRPSLTDFGGQACQPRVDLESLFRDRIGQILAKIMKRKELYQ